MPVASTTTLAIAALIAVTVAIVAFVVHLRFWVGRLTVAAEYSIEETLTCDDGARIELRRVPIPMGRPHDPQRGAPLDLVPVLLVHGIAANHRNQDVHRDHSLARYLADRGRDVWLVTLRSGRPQRGRAGRLLVRLKAMAVHDVQVAVREILARTKAAQVDYVGFSMGGMILYGSLGHGLDPSLIRRAIIVGTPTRLSLPLRVLRRLHGLPRFFVPRLPLRLGARVFAFLSEWLATPLHRYVSNPKNVARGITRAALVNVIEDMPAALNADLFACMTTGVGDVSIDGVAITDHLRDLEIPALFVAGSVDRLAPEASVRLAFEAWGSGTSAITKQFVVLGRAHGQREDYGHGDLTVGANMHLELFPLIDEFLARSSGDGARLRVHEDARVDEDPPVADAQRIVGQ